MEDDDASPRNSRGNSAISNTVVEDEEEEESSIYEVVSERSNQHDSENSDDDPPLKRLKRVKQDRLSELPDSMMTHVLSFLPVIDAVKSQLISKRFRHLWASIIGLWFPTIRVSDGFYAKFITNALMLHKGPLIKKMYLSKIGLSRDGAEPPLNLWVQAAVIKQVEELVLKIHCSIRSFSIPNSLLLCDTLRVFSLSAWEIELGSSVCWKSLRILTLKSVTNLNDDMIHKIVAGSPALESLSLIKCSGLSRVMIDSSSSNLRSLVIDGHFSSNIYFGGGEVREEDQGDDYLEIYAPKITSLEILGYMGDKHCRLKDVPSLVQVALRFSMSTMAGTYWNQHKTFNDSSRAKLEKCERTLLDLLREISHVEKLSMGTWCTQILSMCELRRKPGIFLKCKSLKVDGLFVESVPGIARLIQSSPYLETLFIDLNFDNYDEVELFYEFSDFSGENYWEPKKKFFKHALQCLKVVKLMGFNIMSVSLMEELAEFVLQHAKFLEKLVFKPSDYVFQEGYHEDFRHSNVYEVIQKLLSFPRSSPNARVLLL